ncbi:MAG: helix-turn-helix transcriptional regulator [Alphaproteobacteria bacterium]|nr:helix-turn-helix transcriptional regulator [Alphaproteobacteria bacterium]
MAGEIHELKTYLKTKERVSELQVETTSLRENIMDTKEMTDDELREWIEKHMNESKMFTDPDLSLKDMALRLGLTQKKIKQLVKDSERYNRLYDYLTEKRVLYACELIKANPQWSMEAVSKDSGFVSRTTFQTEFKKRIGVTPAQYRANSQYDVVRVK